MRAPELTPTPGFGGSTFATPSTSSATPTVSQPRRRAPPLPAQGGVAAPRGRLAGARRARSRRPPGRGRERRLAARLPPPVRTGCRATFAAYRTRSRRSGDRRGVPRHLRDEAFHMNYTKGRAPPRVPQRQGTSSGRPRRASLEGLSARRGGARRRLRRRVLLAQYSCSSRRSPGRQGPRGNEPEGWSAPRATRRWTRSTDCITDEHPRDLRPLPRLAPRPAGGRPAGRGGAGGAACRGARTTPPSRWAPSSGAWRAAGSNPATSTRWSSTSGRC